MHVRIPRLLVALNLAALAVLGALWLTLVLTNSSPAELAPETIAWLARPSEPAPGEIQGARAQFELFYPGVDFETVWNAFRRDPFGAKAPPKPARQSAPSQCWDRYWNCSDEERARAKDEVEAARARVEGYRALVGSPGLAQIVSAGSPPPFGVQLGVRNLNKLFLMDLRLRADSESAWAAREAAQAVGFWERVAQGGGTQVSSMVASSLAAECAAFLRGLAAHRLATSSEEPARLLAGVDLSALRLRDPIDRALAASEASARSEASLIKWELERFREERMGPGASYLTLIAFGLLGEKAVDVNESLNLYRAGAAEIFARECYPFQEADRSPCLAKLARVPNVWTWLRNPMGRWYLRAVAPEALGQREGVLRALNRVQFWSRVFAQIDRAIESLEEARELRGAEALAKLTLADP